MTMRLVPDFLESDADAAHLESYAIVSIVIRSPRISD
jgi:hypothetical protein